MSVLWWSSRYHLLGHLAKMVLVQGKQASTYACTTAVVPKVKEYRIGMHLNHVNRLKTDLHRLLLVLESLN